MKKTPYRIVAIGASVWLSVGGSLAAQTVQLSGTAEDEARKPYTDYTIRARDIDTGVVAATAPLDVDDATFELSGLPEKTLVLELLDEDRDVVCTEGPFNLAETPSFADINVECESPLAWWLLAAGAGAAGATTGIVTAGDEAVVPAAPPASPSQ